MIGITSKELASTGDGKNPAAVEVGSKNPIIYKVLYISQVVVWDFFHQ